MMRSVLLFGEDCGSFASAFVKGFCNSHILVSKNSIETAFLSLYDTTFILDNFYNVNFKYDFVVIKNKPLPDIVFSDIIHERSIVLFEESNKSAINEIKGLCNTCVSYGLSGKATVTLSGISEANVIVCIQRKIEYGESSLCVQDYNIATDSVLPSDMLATVSASIISRLERL